ncbi:MAG: hypothetical protein ACK4NU_13155 [Brevundimonas sp.]
MAKVTFPLMSGSVSGKIGDVVFMQRHGNTIVRRRTKPANPRTLKQVITRENLASLSQAWKGAGTLVKQKTTDAGTVNYVVLKVKNIDGTYSEVEFPVLTASEKMTWEEEARKKKGYKSFGRMLFVSTNMKLLNSAQATKRVP